MIHNHDRIFYGRTIVIGLFIALGTLFVFPAAGFGHGGKTHADNPFSAFEAVQQAASLYERLIVSGKLPEAWETDLADIHVFVRGTAAARETVVQFTRTEGDPQSVYFFFDHNGAYSGSNFTGQ